jgi:zinc finger protein
MEFLNKLDEYKTGKHPFTIILEDPLSNCFIYNPKAPEEDPKIKIEIFERTKEQNDELGISDMNV